ncbi:DUF47 domain-containing protein [Peptoniphilus mikwangii]|uniref:DUF47 domain-containing protein n=1 Tax=Peptoniphilus mikwangii TaxID=1354300 RepID=UPI0003F897A8|nr:DUF47 family protein [Peptoniphilus mikwangii]
MNIESFDYFRIFTEMVEGSMAAARLLDEIIKEYDPLTLEVRIKQMHDIEHSNDLIVHEAITHLIRDFLPPLERDDISSLLEELDNPTDSIEDVLFSLYMYNVKEIRAEALEFSSLIIEATDALYDAFIEFKKFRGENSTKEKIIIVNDIESNGDKLYIKTMRNLYTNCNNDKEIIIWTKIFDKLERCLDDLERVANSVESIMISSK